MRIELRAASVDACFPTWLIGPDIPITAYALAALSPAEIERASRFRDARLRRRALRVRAALRVVIEETCAIPVSEQRFRIDAFGKPSLADTPDVSFSISYSGDHGLIGIAKGREIGVDLERIRVIPDVLELMESCFTPSERAAVGGDFLTGWTRKEACLKSLGCGLALPLPQVRCGMVNDDTSVRVAGSVLKVRSSRLQDRFAAAWAWRC